MGCEKGWQGNGAALHMGSVRQLGRELHRRQDPTDFIRTIPRLLRGTSCCSTDSGLKL